ncbi:carbohydrate kinase family protein [Lichenifustis flavocetrariae]|uniref:Carbohydrate kinase family protein n=1 Tax=Lichenifustis flavocetrariae TaxID=2949735 RepID=A0AA41Z5D7_9HYPH|nr:carbohydrate kinase family protein [Lichenifustis flavocetrariae]MCW6510793.1 carbohydrate kinase family protein [Lichenifustis flavocetrariae]
MVHSRRGFVTGGCWCVDRNKTIPFWPSEDMSVVVSASVLRGGGSACNFGIDIRKLDPEMWVETIGLIGDDPEGRFLLEEAARYGIEHSRLQVTSDAPTHITDAFQSLQSGRRTHIFHDGASGRLSPDHFDFAGTTGRILHLGLPGVHAVMDAPWHDDPNGWVTVLKRARAAGLATNLELVTVARDKLAALARPCLPYLDTLIVNDFEIGALAGMTTVSEGVTDVAACMTAARHILEQGAMDVVAVHYVKGAVLVARDGTEIEKPSVRVPDDAYQGANGAGDAFAAGFLYGRHEGWSFDRSLSLAHASAGACLRSITTVDGVDTVAACMALAETWGWR